MFSMKDSILSEPSLLSQLKAPASSRKFLDLPEKVPDFESAFTLAEGCNRNSYIRARHSSKSQLKLSPLWMATLVPMWIFLSLDFWAGFMLATNVLKDLGSSKENVFDCQRKLLLSS